MAAIHTRGHLKNGIVTWILEKNEIEFTESEFMDIIDGIILKGLFRHLEEERPALRSQILAIYARDLADQIEPEDLESVMEQALLDLKQNLRIH